MDIEDIDQNRSPLLEDRSRVFTAGVSPSSDLRCTIFMEPGLDVRHIGLKNMKAAPACSEPPKRIQS